MRDRYELCEEHGDTKIYYDYRLMCPLCDAQDRIEKFEEKIENLEKEETL